MKSPKTKKVVGAFAIVRKGGGLLHWGGNPEQGRAVIHTRKLANLALGDILGGPSDHQLLIVPCTITYSLPTKKSAGKVGKRGV